MGIKYDPSIIGKNYYINLYNKGLESHSKQKKIKPQLEKDKNYLEYLSNNLRKTKENSIKLLGKKNLESNNLDKKCIVDGFNTKLFNTTLFCYSTFNFIENNKKAINKVQIPVDSVKKFLYGFVYSESKELFMKILNYFEKINIDIYHYMYIIIFICLMIFLLIFYIKSRRGKNSFEN